MTLSKFENSGDALGFAALAALCLLALAGLFGRGVGDGATALLPRLDCQPANPSH